MTKEENNRLVNKLPQPCRQDCPNRSPRCHISCKQWQLYEKKRNSRYEKLLVLANIENQRCEAIRKNCTKRNVY